MSYITYMIGRLLQQLHGRSTEQGQMGKQKERKGQSLFRDGYKLTCGDISTLPSLPDLAL